MYAGLFTIIEKKLIKDQGNAEQNLPQLTKKKRLRAMPELREVSNKI